MFHFECVATTVLVALISMPPLTELVSMADGICYRHGAPDGAVRTRQPCLEAKWVAAFGRGWYLLRMCRAATVFACLVLLGSTALSLRGGDWPQWAGSDAKNMVSSEKGFPESFVPGAKTPEGTIDLATAQNVRWGGRIANAIYSPPSIAEGKVFVGAMEQGNGLLV